MTFSFDFRLNFFIKINPSVTTLHVFPYQGRYSPFLLFICRLVIFLLNLIPLELVPLSPDNILSARLRALSFGQLLCLLKAPLYIANVLKAGS